MFVLFTGTPITYRVQTYHIKGITKHNEEREREKKRNKAVAIIGFLVMMQTRMNDILGIIEYLYIYIS